MGKYYATFDREAESGITDKKITSCNHLSYFIKVNYKFGYTYTVNVDCIYALQNLFDWKPHHNAINKRQIYKSKFIQFFIVSSRFIHGH